ncbi:hypothetical protein CDAR_432021 [Caerostris darwini]|uniref:Uncharacterized protein n=1 Tax=Caerostris darwini TaxID=1538125 RepID=A0AAV4TIG8_9ARAC|nr:hypothetical protein CDAR_432021 [Caerostris darwini]
MEPSGLNSSKILNINRFDIPVLDFELIGCAFLLSLKPVIFYCLTDAASLIEVSLSLKCGMVKTSIYSRLDTIHIRLFIKSRVFF